MAFGRVNPQFRLEDQGITGPENVYYNLIEPALIEAALRNGEGRLGKGGCRENEDCGRRRCDSLNPFSSGTNC